MLCSIKAELVHPPFIKSEGVIDLNINVLPYASNASSQDRKANRRQEMEVASTLSHLLLPHLLNRNNLVVLEGRYVWRLNIDILVTHCDGNLMDACSMVIWGALQNLRLPSVVPIEKVASASTSGGSGSGSSSKKTSDEIMLDGDIANSVTPDGVLDCPIVVTVCLIPALEPDEKEGTTSTSTTSTMNTLRKVKKKHQNVMIVDAFRLEESCASTKVSISIDGAGNICGVHKYGSSSVLGNSSGNLKFDMLPKIQSVALSCSQSAFAMLKKSHEDSGTSTRTNANTESVYDNFFRGQFELQ
jgi:exosome complex RNA-binding protein Rrp42 (RNase PH superfamily)